MQNSVSIPEAVWQEELPFSPKLSAFTSGLALTVGMGVRGGKSVPVAAIRYRMPDNVVRRYRGRIAPAIFVVAVSEATGDVYAAPCMGQDAAPATFDPAASQSALAGQPAVGGLVNVDIIAQLGLPPKGGRYLVFAWLDEWVSSTATVNVAEDPRRIESPVRFPANPPGSVRLGPRTGSNASVSVDIAAAKPDKLQATWNTAHAASPVVLLGYELEQRRIRWEVLADAKAPNAKAGTAEILTASFVGTGMNAVAVLAGGHVKSTISERIRTP